MNEDMYNSLEDFNYQNDARVRATYIEEPPKGIQFHWIVCDLCRGEGKVINPSVDAGGLSASDFMEDPDFADDYMSGLYDISCPQCRGRRVVPKLEEKDEND